MPKDDQINYVHEQTIYQHTIEEELGSAALWHTNWGFLANRPQPPPRGFSIATAKYTYGGTKWTLEGKRVPDNSKEGIAAAEAERHIRKTMSEVTWQSVPQKETKRCEAKGYYKGTVLVESDTSGVKNREAALMMRTHNLQTLGDACRTAGLDPTDKYTRPISASHEVGWRARKVVANGRPGLEMFGVSDHARAQVVNKMCYS